MLEIQRLLKQSRKRNIKKHQNLTRFCSNVFYFGAKLKFENGLCAETLREFFLSKEMAETKSLKCYQLKVIQNSALFFCFIYLFLSFFIYFFTYLFIYLFIHLFIYLFTCMNNLFKSILRQQSDL